MKQLQILALVCCLYLKVLPALSSSSIDTCEHDKQCLHRGVCDRRPGTKHKQCQCRNGYTGIRCEQETCPLTCQNGGECLPVAANNVEAARSRHFSSDFVCKCLGRYTGPLCEIPYENCGNGITCLFGGSCVASKDTQAKPAQDKVFCDCPQERTGDYCQEEAPATLDPVVDNKEELSQMNTPPTNHTIETASSKPQKRIPEEPPVSSSSMSNKMQHFVSRVGTWWTEKVYRPHPKAAIYTCLALYTLFLVVVVTWATIRCTSHFYYCRIQSQETENCNSAVHHQDWQARGRAWNHVV